MTITFRAAYLMDNANQGVGVLLTTPDMAYMSDSALMKAAKKEANENLGNWRNGNYIKIGDWVELTDQYQTGLEDARILQPDDAIDILDDDEYDDKPYVELTKKGRAKAIAFFKAFYETEDIGESACIESINATLCEKADFVEMAKQGDSYSVDHEESARVNGRDKLESLYLFLGEDLRIVIAD